MDRIAAYDRARRGIPLRLTLPGNLAWIAAIELKNVVRIIRVRCVDVHRPVADVRSSLGTPVENDQAAQDPRLFDPDIAAHEIVQGPVSTRGFS